MSITVLITRISAVGWTLRGRAAVVRRMALVAVTWGRAAMRLVVLLWVRGLQTGASQIRYSVTQDKTSPAGA
jgi:hypothetical protein